MPERVETRDVICPANTTQANAPERDLTFPAGRVDLIEIHFPSGHVGLTGIAIACAHQIVIPAAGNAWVRGSGNTRAFPTHNYPESGQWSALVYNLDNRAHLWHITFHITETVDRVSLERPAPLLPSQIYGG